jgi:Skp family chaperone for outer membrane proteins
VAATLLGGLVTVYAAAQNPQPPAVPTGGAIGLLDVNYIFKNHQRFKLQMEEMRTDVERAEATVQKDREAIQKLAEELERYKGTRDYRAMEQDIADRQAKLAVQVRMQQREFLEREARIYHNTYKEIWQAVDYYCRNQNLAMVLRFNGDPADATKPEEVLRDINKPVVWYRNGMDITGSILADLNRDQQRVGQPATPGPARSPFQR